MPEYTFKSSKCDLNYFCNDLVSEKTIMLVHGWTGGWEVWTPIIEKLSDYRIYSIDLPGHNKSGHLNNYGKTIYYSDPITEFVGKTFDQQITLVGHSLGATTAIEVSANLPEKIKNLLLVDPPWYPLNSENIETQSTNSTIRKEAKFFQREKPKWRTAIDAVTAFKNNYPEKFREDPYLTAIRAIYVFHHDINIWNVDSNWIWHNAPQLAKNITANTILLGGNPNKGSLMSKDIAKLVKNEIENCEIIFWDTGHGIPREKPLKFVNLINRLMNGI